MQTSIGLPTDIAIRFGREWIANLTQSFDEAAKANVRLVFSELLANAVTANQRVTDKGTVWICFATCGDRCVIVVQDEGMGFTKEWGKFKPELFLTKEPVDPMKESGRGILICRNHCDELTFRRHAEGWSVRAMWRKADSIKEPLPWFAEDDAFGEEVNDCEGQLILSESDYSDRIWAGS
jgi:anti-sigma regulatory factor (Ser/Thr protein kinase)